MVWKRYAYLRTVAAIALGIMLMAVLPASARLQLLTQPTQTVTSARGAVGNGFLSTPGTIGAEFTIRTVSTVVGNSMNVGGETMWLAGFGTQKGAVPSALAITWSPKASWFGYTWQLQLRSEANLIPAELANANGGDTTVTEVDLVQSEPQPGHKYETLFGYNAALGTLALRFTDLTDAKVIYQGAFSAGKSNAPFFATAGQEPVSLRTEEQQRLSIDSIETFAKFLPVGLNWAVGLKLSGADFLPMVRFDRADDISLKVSALGNNLPGELLLQSVTDQATRLLARAAASSQMALPSVPGTNLPLGASALRLEYSENGVVLLSDAQEFTVGVLKAEFSNAQLDKEKKQFKTNAMLSSNGKLDNIDLDIKATINELVWNTQKRAYENKPVETVTLFKGSVDVPNQSLDTIPLTMQIPEQPGYYQVNLTVISNQRVGIKTSNVEQRFSTYWPAAPASGEPYTIALLPDTQYYTQSYPDIYIRQLQWLAEQAKSSNIVLTLGLGDITDDDIPGQWLNAVESFKLINGVMPYMLAQGNHDLKSQNGDFKDRKDSLINSYFPLASQPWIAGTFEKDRIENSYSLFNFQGTDYLVLSLEFGPRDAVLAWANQVAAKYPNHKVIMITHNYTGKNGGRSNSATGYPLPDTNAGPDMWYNLVQKHANFQLVFSGHIHSDAIPINVGLGENKNWVYEMLMDYQGDPTGGNGYLCLVTFHPDGRIEVRSYSPYLGQERNQRDGYGYANRFFIDPANGKYMKP